MIDMAIFAALISAIHSFRDVGADALKDMMAAVHIASMEVNDLFCAVLAPQLSMIITIVILVFAIRMIMNNTGPTAIQMKLITAALLAVFVSEFLDDGKHIRLIHSSLYSAQSDFMDALPGSTGGGPIGLLTGLNRGMDGIEAAGAELKEKTYEAIMTRETGEVAKPEKPRSYLDAFTYKMKRFNAAPGAMLKSKFSEDGIIISVTLLILYVVFFMCWIVFFLMNSVGFLMASLLVALSPIFIFGTIFDRTRPAFFVLLRQFWKFFITPMIAAVLISFLHMTVEGAGAAIADYDLLKDSADNSALWGYIAAGITIFVGLVAAYPLSAALVNASAGPMGATIGLIAGGVGSTIMSKGMAAGKGMNQTGARFKNHVTEKYG